MSKNTQSTNFRKLNVSPYSDDEIEDNVTNDDDQAGPSEAEVTSLLNANKNADALKLVLTNPPINKDDKTKGRVFKLVLRVLSSFKTGDMDGALRALEQPTLDTLMKYIYRGFAEPTDGTSLTLLTWHEKAFAVGGVGTIVRVLTDRKKV